ncbi:MAG: reverse transcriptase family protein [Saprospiraceae bacterium]
MTYWKKVKEKKEWSSTDMREIASTFLEADSLKSLSYLLKVDLSLLKSIAFKPKYKQFYIPKPNGKKRLIESPSKKLKWIQKKLAFYFQSIYTGLLPSCSYGFVMHIADREEIRDIYSNAMAHVEKKWVYGLDLKDFFHAISQERITAMLRKPPFQFSKSASQCLSQLVCFNGRLPMGSPCSPVLSNLICLGLDEDLETLALKNGWTYTRFADDMTFSGMNEFDDDAQQSIRKCIQAHQFIINEKKTNQTRDSDGPEITGLVIKDSKPDLSKGYIKTLKQDIKIFHALTKEHILNKSIFPAQVIQQFRLSLKGQVQFVGFVRGENHKSYVKLKYRLEPPKRER